ncbi:MAG TPA: WYL domain-containing protein [Acidimicrobiales bacterium]|nr:WYL domain-containing protein [Acidimicrobiales bacterium]
MSTEARLRRVLAMVPWIVAQQGPTIEEVCARFGCTEAELVKDLEGALFFCGVHPFTPGDMVEVDISEGRVWIRLADYFSRPLRLTPAEGLGLLGAARAASSRGTESDDALSRAVAKLSAAIGVDPDEVLDVELGDAEPGVLGILEESAAAHEVVEIDYYSYGRDSWQTRPIEAHHVFNSNGAWYAWAWCRKVDDWRLFRADRVRTATPLGEHFEMRKMPSPPKPWSGPAVGEEVVLELAPGAAWAIEEYPVVSVRAGKQGWRKVTLRIAGRPWLERLLLRLGSDARMVKGDANTAVDAASRILARYRTPEAAH